MIFSLVLFIAIAGQGQPTAQAYPMGSMEECLAKAKERLALGMAAMAKSKDIEGIAAMCTVSKPPGRDATK